MRRVVTVGPEVGLHARPAAALVAAAARAPGAVRIGREDAAGASMVDAKSILSVLTLGAERGQRLILEAEDAAVLDELATLIETP
ncbi:hypothetical protein GCM10023321_79610 [Pseudonocardia eucalypti]|uniref:Phosphocarrier protein HPr n=1 Tax=Pseudonocardia eucalypti TaxID=648755 RepID=A0ABP9RCV9_9PSEU|nr:phosphocarrier protein [Pseudonocardia eucalypti]